MRYLGGKTRIAKEIAAVVAPRGYWWEPFCGGLSVSVQLAKYGPGLVSDVHPALMALYQAVRDGWEPPSTLSKEAWQAARSLPDTDPLKAFAGFFHSFNSIYFQSYDGGGRVWNNDKRGGRWITLDRTGSARLGLRQATEALRECTLARLDFFAERNLSVRALMSSTPTRLIGEQWGTAWTSTTRPSGTDVSSGRASLACSCLSTRARWGMPWCGLSPISVESVSRSRSRARAAHRAPIHREASSEDHPPGELPLHDGSRLMPRKKVATITIDVLADGGCMEIEMRSPMPNGRMRAQLVNVRRADKGGARQALDELELSLADALEDGLRAALPYTRR